MQKDNNNAVAGAGPFTAERTAAMEAARRLRDLDGCDPECHGRCRECPRDVAREAADAIDALLASEPDPRVGALRDMEARKDAAYLERNQVVAALASVFPSGIARTDIPGWLPEWHGCVYIDLPTGQASWHYHDSHAHLFAHLPPYRGTWDGHTTEEKYERLTALASPPRDGGKPPDPCEHDWIPWVTVEGARKHHYERQCSKCKAMQYDD